MKQLRFAAVLALALAVPAAHGADFPEGAQNRFQFELGGAWDSFDTEARLDVTRDGVVSAGTTIDFEKLLDVPVMQTHFRGMGQWRFSNVSYLQFGFDTIAREGRRVIDADITWGELTYAAGGQIDGRFDSDEVYLGYRFDMFRADNVRVGATLGVSYWAVEASLEGEGKVTRPDGTFETGSFERGFDVKAPVPVLGIVVDGAISSQVTFGFYVRTLFLHTDEASGGTLSGGLNAKWYFTKHLGVGAGVDVNTIRIKEYVDDDRVFSAHYTFAGPRLFAVASF
ncbi:MAG: hypothetical protein KJ062_07795 [Thermoanaerobaculia bacterium]|nr:hypothetical protein [Thermoanaerobaculia bacterium]